MKDVFKKSINHNHIKDTKNFDIEELAGEDLSNTNGGSKPSWSIDYGYNEDGSWLVSTKLTFYF